jgi:CRISPR-associated protein Csy2
MEPTVHAETGGDDLMKSLLILRHLTVENANAIAGLTYGFPAISAFLGFTHALSRKSNRELGVSLGGCGVVCHGHQIHAYQPGDRGDFVFALTRNPLTKEGRTAAFVEEGRMNMDVSLLIECDFDIEDVDFSTDDAVEDRKLFEEWIQTQVLTQRLAGGTITGLKTVDFEELGSAPEERRRQMRGLLYRSLPGTALLDRTSLLQEHHQRRCEQSPDSRLLDSWLDFAALKWRAIPELAAEEEPTEEHSADWEYMPKPAGGWLVPITVGYKAIAPLYDNKQVARTRDDSTPFRFAELAYGIGQWISPHRIRDIEELIWRYHNDGEWYLC